MLISGCHRTSRFSGAETLQNKGEERNRSAELDLSEKFRSNGRGGGAREAEPPRLARYTCMAGSLESRGRGVHDLEEVE